MIVKHRTRRYGRQRAEYGTDDESSIGITWGPLPGEWDESTSISVQPTITCPVCREPIISFGRGKEFRLTVHHGTSLYHADCFPLHGEPEVWEEYRESIIARRQAKIDAYEREQAIIRADRERRRQNRRAMHAMTERQVNPVTAPRREYAPPLVLRCIVCGLPIDREPPVRYLRHGFHLDCFLATRPEQVPER